MATELRRTPALPTGAEKRTERRDAWWIGPAFTFLAYGAFVVYATFRVFENNLTPTGTGYFEVGPYLSPFGSPDLTFLLPAFVQNLVPFAIGPGLLILPFPAGFRFTCYYYRKSYYRAFAATPPACAVAGLGAPRLGGTRKYKGETGILVFQNLHRFFLYAAIVIVFILLYDAFHSVRYRGEWYFGVGSAILFLNVVFLAAYTFGCHALRHLVGGKLDCFSCDVRSRVQYSLWQRVTRLNEQHALFAWISLFTVALSDVYIRHVAKHNPDLTPWFGVIPV